jgi:hypothetical protein
MKALIKGLALLLANSRSNAFTVQQRPCPTFYAMAALATKIESTSTDNYAIISGTLAAPLLPKVFESALAIVPPDDMWPALQRARTEQRDAGLLRWPPHANVLYPFVPLQHFDKLGPALADALKDLPPFTVTLAKFASFDRKDSSVRTWPLSL